MVLLACFAACDSRSIPPAADGSGPVDGTDDSVVVQLLRDPIAVEPFTLTDLEGRTLSSADWKGKVVLVNFWATWCPPCLAEIPDLIALQNKYRDRLVVVGISEDEISPDLVKRFATDRKINYPIAMTNPRAVHAVHWHQRAADNVRARPRRTDRLQARRPPATAADRGRDARAGRHEPAGAR